MPIIGPVGRKPIGRSNLIGLARQDFPRHSAEYLPENHQEVSM
jgi:hypothetical protein